MIRASFLILHRYAGLLMAGFLIIAGLTGALLAFHHELDHWLNKDLMVAELQNSPTINLTQVTNSIERSFPNYRIDFIDLERKSSEAYVARVSPIDPSIVPKEGKVNQIFVHPYTAEIIGARDLDAIDLSRKGLMPFIFNLHYTLLFPNDWGRWLLGVIAIIWLFDSFIGFYLTWPKGEKFIYFRKFLNRWQPAWKIKTTSGKARLNFDIHRASGLWLWPVLIVTAFTSIYFNLNSEVFKPVVGLFTTFSPMPNEILPRVVQKRPKLNFDEALNRGLELRPEAAKNLPISYISYSPKHNVYRLTFDEREVNTWFRFRREQVFFDGDTGEYKALWGYSKGTSGDKFSSWQFPLHSGQMFGLPGRILILITGLLTASLSITGIFIWNRKRKSKKVVKQTYRLHPSKKSANPIQSFSSLRDHND